MLGLGNWEKNPSCAEIEPARSESPSDAKVQARRTKERRDEACQLENNMRYGAIFMDDPIKFPFRTDRFPGKSALRLEAQEIGFQLHGFDHGVNRIFRQSELG
jgi:hypothetical protein